jgi:glycosyltransferase involved in cell wall biosynthesis
VVASNTGGTPEVVGDAGFLFKRDDAEDLARLLLPLITDVNLRNEYAQKARQRAEEFTWGRCWESILAHLGMSKPSQERTPELAR